MAAAALVDAPNIDWTEDDGLYRRVELFRRDVENMMLGPLLQRALKDYNTDALATREYQRISMRSWKGHRK